MTIFMGAIAKEELLPAMVEPVLVNPTASAEPGLSGLSTSSGVHAMRLPRSSAKGVVAFWVVVPPVPCL